VPIAFSEVEETTATGPVAALYADLRATMRSTFVPTAFRALAFHSAYLIPAWTALRPNLASAEAETLAGRLRVTCVERLKEIVGRPRAPSVALDPVTHTDIRGVLETFFYVLPKFLLALIVLREAWEGRGLAGRVQIGSVRTVPPGAPASMPAVRLLPLDSDDPRVRRLFQAASRMMGRPEVPSLYRALARWPDYLEAVWDSVAEARIVEAYRVTVPGLVEELVHGCRTLPFAFVLDRATVARSVEPDGLTAIDGLLATYQRDMAETVLQTARLLRDLTAPARPRR